jgi:hypothetical protein
MLGTYWTCPKTIRANPIVPSGNGFVDSPDCHVSLDDVAHYASGWTGTDSFALLQMSCEKSCGVPCEFCIASTDLAGCDGSLVKSCGEFSYENVKLHSHLQTGSYSLIRLPNGETVLIAGLAGMMGLSPTQVVVAKMQESGFGPLRSLRASLKNEALSFVKWGDFIGIFHWVDDGTDSLFVSRIPLDHIMNVLGAD